MEISLHEDGKLEIVGGDRPFYTPEDIASEIGVSVDVVRRWLRSGKIIGARKIGRKWIIVPTHKWTVETMVNEG
jgi:excisionase family DNA binding protein